ncbi:MAG TPA: 4Fe-4S binding protein [Erysipelotrichaceae bacterium]|nr:4Fe-4S binding protein [Erysipelotrichaceae bacterium]
MKQLLILSGKGGTGKTTVASAFIKLLKAKTYADCDVDAPNLHLVMAQKSEPKKTDYYGMPVAVINKDKCIRCGLCKESCRFEAISLEDDFKINPFACEGCGVCELVCPVNAVNLKPAISGQLTLYADDENTFSTAQLKMGVGASGLLVTEVKKQMKTAANPRTKIAIIDGSPGIGCPVIASLSGVDMVLIVAEPSVSGISDMERIIKTARTFETQIAVCVNKYDSNILHTQKIENFCKEEGIVFTGKIPFDENAVKAINNGQTVVDIDCPSGLAIRKVFKETMLLLQENNQKSFKNVNMEEKI